MGKILTIQEMMLPNKEQIEVRAVVDKPALLAFVHFPFELYKDSEQWIPPLRHQEIRYLWQNPAREEFHIQLFLAYLGDHVVGRIGVLCRKDPTFSLAKFGWFDVKDDLRISASLFEAAEAWAWDKGKTSLHGPYGFSSLDRLGILTEGFAEQGTYSTSYNHAYYETHVQKWGFTLEESWVEYELEVPEQVPDQITRLSNFVKRQGRYSLISCKTRKALAQYKQTVFNIMLQCYGQIPSFEYLSRQQVQYYIDRNFRYIQPGYVSIAQDRNGEVVGFAITAPSISKAMIKNRGKRSLAGILRLLKAMKVNDRADFYLIAILPEHQGKGIPILFIEQILQTFQAKGIKRVETNPEMQSNYKVQMLWKFFKKRQHKRRNTYVKSWTKG